MNFLATSSKVPVTKSHTAFRDPVTNKTYIIMGYLPGDTLQKKYCHLLIQLKKL